MPDSVIDQIEELLRLMEATKEKATDASGTGESLAQLERLARLVRFRESGCGPHRIKEIRTEMEKLHDVLADIRNRSIQGEDAHALLVPVHSKVEALVRDLDAIFAPDLRHRH